MAVTSDHTCSYQRGMNWYTYQNLEDELIESSKHVTIDDKNDDTWSEKLANLLILIGSAVDTFFRDMQDCTYVKSNSNFLTIETQIKNSKNKYRGKRDWDITNFRDAFEPIYELSQNSLKVPFGLGVHKDITPFCSFSRKKIPDWWTFYNGLKHNYYNSLANAKLIHVLNSLGGLLILNSLHLCNQVYLAINNLISPIKLGIPTESRVKFLEGSNIGYIRSVPWSEGAFIVTKLFVFELRGQFEVK